MKATKPYWRRAIPHLRDAYDHTCAYLGMRINTATAHATADHFISRSVAPDRAYDWDNLRLAATTVNTLKRDAVIPVDPFSVEKNEFRLNLISGKVEEGVTERPDDVRKTIAVLRLNDEPFVTHRLEYVNDYLAGRISLEHLARWFPFGAAELSRRDP